MSAGPAGGGDWVSWLDAYNKYVAKVGRFKSLRPSQAEILNQIPDPSEAGLVVVSAPPGVGKSLVGILRGLSVSFPTERYNRMIPLGPHVHIVTPTKGLQDQYRRDLGDICSANGWRYTVLKGRQNYRCPLRPNLTADRCPVLNLFHMGRSFCKYKPLRYPSPPESDDFVQTFSGDYLVPPSSGEWCPYWQDKFCALQSNFAVFNYHYFLYELFYVGDFVPALVVVFDEVHRLFDAIDSVFSLRLYPRVLEYFEIPVVRYMQDPVLYASTLLSEMRAVLANLENKLAGFSREDFEDPELRSFYFTYAAKYSKLYDIYVRLSIFSRSRQFFYARVKPFASGAALFIRPYPHFVVLVLRRLLGGVGTEYSSIFRSLQVIALSATPGPRQLWHYIANAAGVPFTYVEYDRSPFPVHRRLVFVPTDAPRVTETVLRKELGRFYDLSRDGVAPISAIMRSSVVCSQAVLIKQLYEMFGRVLVHSWNNKLAGLVTVLLEHMGVPVQFPQFRPTEEIHEWMDSGDSTVLVTAAAKEGVDLAYEKARVQVILKLPVPNLRDPYVSSLRRNLPVYYNYSIAAALVQQSGRVVRARDDWGFTIIYDSAARNWILEHSHYFPRYFREALVTHLNTKQVLDYIATQAVDFQTAESGRLRR